MLRSYPSVLLRVVLELTYLPIFVLSIFAVMCIFDQDTPWGVGPLRGPGASPDFAYIAAVLALGWTVLALGWRGARTAFKVLIVVWHLALLAAFVALLIDKGNLIFHGEAIGLTISLELLGPALSLASLGCAVGWIVIDARHGSHERSVSPLRRRNHVAFVISVVALLAAGVAFWLDQDEVGSVACAVAMLGCHEIMRPINPSEELHKAFVREGSAPR